MRTPSAAVSAFSVRRPSEGGQSIRTDRKSTRLNSSHRCISYAVFCLKKKKTILESLGDRDFQLGLGAAGGGDFANQRNAHRAFFAHANLLYRLFPRPLPIHDRDLHKI